MTEFVKNKIASDCDYRKYEIAIPLKKILANLSHYALIGLILEERAECGDKYAKTLIDIVMKKNDLEIPNFMDQTND